MCQQWALSSYACSVQSVLCMQELAAYRRQPVPGALEGQALRKYYSALIDKYIPGGVMAF